VQKAYHLIFGRAATDAEIAAAVQYLATEPMKEYEERKKVGETGSIAGKKEAASRDDDKDPPGEKNDDSMMAGVIPGAAKRDDAKKMLPVTPWGRYLKTLLSSNEFIFVS